MTNFLVKLFIKDYKQISSHKVRQKYGLLGGCVGIVCNLLLFLAKVFAGILTGSISITADAFNNLSDAGACVVTVVGFKMAGMPADEKHPFGHGRIEYVSGLIISMAIMFMGFELGRSSVLKMIHPEEVTFHWVSVIILAISIAVKLWMGLFNRTLGKKIDSMAMKANAMDSISDCIATGAVLIGLFVFQMTNINIDAIIGILVAGFIFYTGLQTARDTLNPLLGQAPDSQFVKEVEESVLSYPEIMGIHDLIVHNYGPGRSVVSLHAEVPCHSDILMIHDVIDNIERDLKKEFQCEIVIHMDPIATDDEETNRMRGVLQQIVKTIHPALCMHDFRMVNGPTHTNLIFDVVVPPRFEMSDLEIGFQIRKAIKQIDEKYEVVINFDKGYL